MKRRYGIGVFSRRTSVLNALLTHPLRSFVILIGVCVVLSSCVRYEDDDQGGSQPQTSSLDDIKRQLEQPIVREKIEPTAKPTEPTGRWKAHEHKNDIPNVDPQKTLIAEVIDSQKSAPWPPRVGHRFPNMSFLTMSSQKRSIEDFKGKVALIEYATMNSSTTQALSGSAEKGPFGAAPVTRNFQSLEKYFPTYAGGTQASEVSLIQILLLDYRSKPVTPAIAESWSKHFGLESRGRTILIGSTALLQGDGASLLGGFQLLDKNLVVRGDATGERSKTLFSELFPLIPRYVKAQ